MKLNLQPDSEAKLRELAERRGVTPERYAEDVLSAHIGAYDKWFVAAVEKGLKDVAEGRVVPLEQSKIRNEARRARLRSRKRRS
jgi:predicted transcriptional regulator